MTGRKDGRFFKINFYYPLVYMIRFERNENTVIVKVEHGIFYNDAHFAFEIGQSQNYQAVLLRDALQKNLMRHQKMIEQRAYNQGWKDAKAKTKKQTEFYGGWK